MRRCSLLIMLFLAVAVWALSAPDADSVLAGAANDRQCSVSPEPAFVRIDTGASILPEPLEAGSPVEVDAMLTNPANQPESLISSGSYDNGQWVLGETEVSSLWRTTRGSREVIVAVLDTGIDRSHEELSGQVIAETNLTGSFTPSDIRGHGTHVAGIIAAKDDGVGVTGVAPGCSLLNVKVADDSGRCQASVLAEGILWAVDNGARVINISIELTEPSPALERAIDYAWDCGCLVIAAAGNDGSDSPVYPAGYERCLAVAATKPDKSLAPLSNYGDWVDVLAPGFDIYSTLPNDGYGYKSGTSFASAYVTGIAALLFDVVADTNGNGKLNDEVWAIIKSGFKDGPLVKAS